MFIIDNIDTRWFLISLCVGLLMVYCTTPMPDVIIKYPTPFNSHRMVFKDDVDNCYKFNTHEVSCPKKELISEFPIQTKVDYFNKDN
tara:strand:- start:494 stop:754 length:261 start_codon:yes stop_codon:yes gene_type:complete